MKKICFSLIIISIVLFLNSCNKDEYGIKYYKHVTGEGCAFYKYLDGTIAPFANLECGIEAIHEFAGMGGSTIGNLQGMKTDANGNYTCRFVKSVEGWDMKSYTIRVTTNFIPPIDPNADSTFYSVQGKGIDVSVIKQIAATTSKKNPQTVFIDTIWVVQKKPFSY